MITITGTYRFQVLDSKLLPPPTYILTSVFALLHSKPAKSTVATEFIYSTYVSGE
jgi:hypothetical protein